MKQGQSAPAVGPPGQQALDEKSKKRGTDKKHHSYYTHEHVPNKKVRNDFLLDYWPLFVFEQVDNDNVSSVTKYILVHSLFVVVMFWKLPNSRFY
jgi:hypothetical protein